MPAQRLCGFLEFLFLQIKVLQETRVVGLGVMIQALCSAEQGRGTVGRLREANRQDLAVSENRGL